MPRRAKLILYRSRLSGYTLKVDRLWYGPLPVLMIHGAWPHLTLQIGEQREVDPDTMRFKD